MGGVCCAVSTGDKKEGVAADVRGGDVVAPRPVLPEEGEGGPEDAAEEEKKRMGQAKRGKRAGISSESVSADQAANYVKPVYPKDNATKDAIKKTLKSNDKMQVLFGHLDGVPLEDVINAFQTREVRQGQEIIRQGDEGDSLYIIADGSVDVHVARPDATGKLQPNDRGPKVVSLGTGALFGELALMYTAPRAATVVVGTSTAKLWALDREPFKMLLMKSSQQQYAKYEGWLSEVELFKTMNHFELTQLTDLLESTLYDDGEVIIKQGEIGDKFYILEDGTCSAYIEGAGGEKEVKKYDRQGEYFGEIALLKDEPRKATVRATGEGATVMSITKEDFTNVLGPITDLLKKDVDRYPQYADLLK